MALLNDMLEAFRQGDLPESDAVADTAVGPNVGGSNEDKAGEDN
jgi:hypothetical protein